MPAIEQRNNNGRPYLRLFKAVIAVSSSCSCWNLLSFLHQGDSFKMVSSKVMKCLSKYSLCWNFPTCTRQHENKTKIAYLKHLSAQMYHGRENFIKSWNYFLIIFLSRSRLVEKYARCIGKTVNTKHTFCLSQTNLCTGKDLIPRLLLIFGDLGNENSLIFSIFTVSSIEFTANFIFLSSYSWPGGCETLFATKACWWLMFNLLPTRTLKSVSVEESHSQVQVLAIPFVELHKIPAGPFLQAVEAALKGDTSIWFIGHSSHCCNSTAPSWQHGSQALPFWGDCFLALFFKWKEFSQSWSHSTCPSVSNI